LKIKADECRCLAVILNDKNGCRFSHDLGPEVFSNIMFRSEAYIKNPAAFPQAFHP
jgi:hypothetical protein